MLGLKKLEFELCARGAKKDFGEGEGTDLHFGKMTCVSLSICPTF